MNVDEVSDVLDNHVQDGPYTVATTISGWDSEDSSDLHVHVEWRCRTCPYVQHGVDFDRHAFNRHIADQIIALQLPKE